MAIDQGEATKPAENLARQRPYLLFHVSGLGSDAVEPMTKMGLLSKSPTLTPRLDIATYYSGGNLLTFWYPIRGEVNHLRSDSASTPTAPVTAEMKEAMLEDVAKLDIDPWTKEAYTRIIGESRTYLPASRLRAVAKISGVTPPRLQMILPEDADDFISLYTEKGPELREKVRNEVNRMKIDFLDPNLTQETLAEDILRTYVEHNLLAMGEYPGGSKKILEKNLHILKKGSFEDPIYERYRKMLIERIQTRIEGIPEPTT